MIEYEYPYDLGEPGDFLGYTAVCGRGSQSYSMGSEIEGAVFDDFDQLRKTADFVCRTCFPDYQDVRGGE